MIGKSGDRPMSDCTDEKIKKNTIPCQIVSACATMMRWMGKMDAQRALVEGGKDDAGTGELVIIFIIFATLTIFLTSDHPFGGKRWSIHIKH